mmetsp:Transcript_3931/g.6027  ORF Transcript_3931/g.6027 Transcript_3931/m.6027 type:complete len:275 (-) Transcript_3931:81-905(-)|eukprot:CAMPEP_0184672166 /NCGR_PEP_ID=MMETSP0308-20130426/85935_1 /TAXON_ID=38269 /ORGANISM="Gloeochaete witrockiana, Strain SAG 46.84" /LENGTH=274 /DNA_ID=CAMNT_0027119439 /DNA_START=167 /DNA_END=991 /DNA_ORIENTATION=-
MGDRGPKDDAYRMNLVEYLVRKRTSNFAYIKRFHEDRSVAWMNTTLMADIEIDMYFRSQGEKMSKRLEQWFVLGVSMAPLLQQPNGSFYIRALSQLIEEFDYYCANAVEKNVKRMKARQTAIPQPVAEDEPVKGAIYKSGKYVVFTYLLIQSVNIPFGLDYRQVIFTMCEILTLVYRKFLDDSSCSSNLNDAILRFDARITSHVIIPLTTDLTSLSMKIINMQLSSLDSSFQSQISESLPLESTLPNESISESDQGLSESSDDPTLSTGRVPDR